MLASLEKREKILVSGAGAAVVALAINYLVCGKSDSSAPEVTRRVAVKADEPKNAGTANEVTSKALRKRTPQTNRVAFASWRRDPFAETWRLVEADASAEDSSALVLRGVIRKGNEAYVLIGDQILKVGDVRGDLKVVAIERDYVVVRKGRKIVRLILGNE
ncbi:hypothetical protein MJD09_20075 [bacterium]|nr:hypothetical protein [bacterium]